MSTLLNILIFLENLSLTKDQTHNLSISRWCSYQPSYLTRAENLIFNICRIFHIYMHHNVFISSASVRSCDTLVAKRTLFPSPLTFHSTLWYWPSFCFEKFHHWLLWYPLHLLLHRWVIVLGLIFLQFLPQVLSRAPLSLFFSLSFLFFPGWAPFTLVFTEKDFQIYNLNPNLIPVFQTSNSPVYCTWPPK